MSIASGYSLWLIPDTQSDVYRVLADCIAEIAKEYQTPNFIPHVTLLGGVVGSEEEVCDKTKQLVGMLAPYEIGLGEMSSNGTHFQQLFSKVKKTKRVIRANRLAQEVFGVHQGSYFPHASLVYGDVSSAQRMAILQQMVLPRSPLIIGSKFTVRAVELWRTAGKVQDWHQVAVFPFKG